jgi:NAD(P)-dependent dehydrogenase (short-subunit alcohol dehydrogenase family)
MAKALAVEWAKYLFLASDTCSFLTGSAILIDGGWTCL